MDVDSTPYGKAQMSVGEGNKKASFDSLNDDVLLVVIAFLDTPSLLIFGKVYDRIAKLIRETNVRQLNSYRTSLIELIFSRKSLDVKFAAL